MPLGSSVVTVLEGKRQIIELVSSISSWDLKGP